MTISFGGNGVNEVKQAKIRCEQIRSGQFSDEVVVTMASPEGRLVGIFPSSSTDSERRTVSVFVVDEKAGQFLVELPAHTFTSGSKVWFPKASVMFEGNSA